MTEWVFGYGSLTWNPEFDPVEAVTATLPGYQRSFCMRSFHHRGTEEAPGLVLALDEAPETECRGLALRIPDDRATEIVAALRARELVTAAYYETRLGVQLDDGREVEALAYVVDPDHVQYCGGLPEEDQARIIAHAHGGRGPNRDYLWSTAEHLSLLGIEDAHLTRLASRVREIVDKSLA